MNLLPQGHTQKISHIAGISQKIMQLGEILWAGSPFPQKGQN
jgi:hypothetical protein